MNNDKYAKYSTGKVTYGSNGAYTSTVSKKDNGSCVGALAMWIIPAGLVAALIMQFVQVLT